MIQKDNRYAQGENALTSEYSIKGSVFLEAPLIQQLPELPRGCEITSLAMLLAYNGIETNKMDLAKEIKKDPTPHVLIDNQVHFGNPHLGFVGDMYSFETPGLGVYNEPIAELAAFYAGAERVHNFSGESFTEIINQLNNDRPVWVIINASYKELPKDQFKVWQTSQGPVEITMREHSVLITGYDQEYIYFNDPLNRETRAPIDDFKAAWKQMGKQAITIL